MPEPRSFHFKLPPYQGALLPEPPAAWYPAIRPHHAACTSDRTLRSDGRVRAFVIHATAGGSSAGAMSVMFEHRSSWHWLVPDEDEPEHGVRVWACAPERRAAWHVRNSCSHPDVNNGSANVNYWSLGLEIVNTQSGDAFSDWQVEQAAALVRYAWSKYKDLVDVVSHAKLDPERRTDPGPAFPWDRFRALVLEPAPPVDRVAPAPLEPITIVGPGGAPIACDPRTLDGVTVGELRPLVEALGFRVEYEDGPPRTMRIVGGPPRSRARRKPTRRGAARGRAKGRRSGRGEGRARRG
jgi:N-acetylmuramoyl-L-alanine amidase